MLNLLQRLSYTRPKVKENTNLSRFQKCNREFNANFFHKGATASFPYPKSADKATVTHFLFLSRFYPKELTCVKTTICHMRHALFREQLTSVRVIRP